jgi:hypothetical protein
MIFVCFLSFMKTEGSKLFFCYSEPKIYYLTFKTRLNKLHTVREDNDYLALNQKKIIEN